MFRLSRIAYLCNISMIIAGLLATFDSPVRANWGNNLMIGSGVVGSVAGAGWLGLHNKVSQLRSKYLMTEYLIKRGKLSDKKRSDLTSEKIKLDKQIKYWRRLLKWVRGGTLAALGVGVVGSIKASDSHETSHNNTYNTISNSITAGSQISRQTVRQPVQATRLDHSDLSNGATQQAQIISQISTSSRSVQGVPVQQGEKSKKVKKVESGSPADSNKKKKGLQPISLADLPQFDVSTIPSKQNLAIKKGTYKILHVDGDGNCGARALACGAGIGEAAHGNNKLVSYIRDHIAKSVKMLENGEESTTAEIIKAMIGVNESELKDGLLMQIDSSQEDARVKKAMRESINLLKPSEIYTLHQRKMARSPLDRERWLDSLAFSVFAEVAQRPVYILSSRGGHLVYTTLLGKDYLNNGKDPIYLVNQGNIHWVAARPK